MQGICHQQNEPISLAEQHTPSDDLEESVGGILAAHLRGVLLRASRCHWLERSALPEDRAPCWHELAEALIPEVEHLLGYQVTSTWGLFVPFTCFPGPSAHYV